MSWLYLLIASIFEMGWPIGLKIAHYSDVKIFWIIFAIVTMGLSGYFLYIAQKNIPIGIAYSVWTGIGMVGTFLIGITMFHDAFSIAKFVGVFLILTGIIVLRIF